MTYKTFFHSTFFLILFGIWDISAQENLEFTREKSYKSLRLTYEDFSKLLITIQEYLTHFSTDTSDIVIDKAAVENKSVKLTLTGNYQLEGFEKAPTKAISARYLFYARQHPIGQIR